MGYQNDPTAADISAGFQPFHKTSDISGHTPGTGFVFGPSVAYVLIDEKDTSIDDGEFLVNETVNNVIANIPASYHAGAGGVTFADGHAEIHKWRTAEVLLPAQQAGIINTPHENFISCNPGNIDLLWLQDHATYSTTAFQLPGQ
jgi:prepilin-type processing-associated H-X9-DG protein